MKPNYQFEDYNYWSENNLIQLERKLENETAFDGIVKIYSLKSNINQLNKLLLNKYFGDFIHYSESGVFLRMFDNKNSWPKTSLIYVDFKNYNLTEVKKTNSSWNVWSVNDLGNRKYSIEINPTEKIEFETPI